MTDAVGTHGHQLVVCTVCGASQPLVSAYEKPEARAAWEAALAFAPRPLVGLLVRYLDLFSPPGRMPQERVVARVLGDLAGRIQAGTVTRQGITFAAPLEAWELALRLLVSGQTEVSLPLKTNSYLAGIVWRRADAAAGRAERAKEEDAASGTGRVSGGGLREAGAVAPAQPPRAQQGPRPPAQRDAAVKAIGAVLADLGVHRPQSGDDDGQE